MKAGLQLRIIGIIGLIGIFIFGLFSLLHPPTFNPWDTINTFEKVSHHHFWVLDHIFILIGITFWLLALAAGQSLLSREGALKKVGAWLFIVSLALWIVILTFEIGVIPQVVNGIKHHQNETLMSLWFVVFCFSLLGGYIAFILTWLGVVAYCLVMDPATFPRWFRLWGIWSGTIGGLGIIVGLIKIDYVVLILGLTSGPPFIWTILFCWFMVKRI